MPTTDAPAQRPRFLDGVLAAAIALVHFVVLRQHTPYSDSTIILHHLEHGGLLLANHLLVLPALAAWRWLLSPLHLPLPTALTLGSACATALSVLVLHRAAAALDLSRPRALGACVVLAACPGVVFLATVLEKYALCLLAGALAFWVLARLVAAPSLPRAAALGAAIGACSLVHATHNLLACALLPFGLALLLERLPARRCLALLGASVTTQVAFLLSMAALLPALGLPWSLGAAASRAANSPLAAQALGSLLRSGWNAWLEPFLPGSLLVWLAFARPGLRGHATALAFAVAVYSLASFLMIGDSRGHGQYLLPLALPLAVLMARLLPPLVLLLLGGLGFALAVVDVKAHDHPERLDRYLTELREVAGAQKPFLLMGCAEDLEVMTFRKPALDNFFLPDIGGLPADSAPVVLPRLDQLLRDKVAGGAVVFLTRAAEEWLVTVQAASERHLAGALWKHLHERYELRPLDSNYFRGYRLVLRT